MPKTIPPHNLSDRREASRLALLEKVKNNPISNAPRKVSPPDVIRYAPACGVCPPSAFLVYMGGHQMYCPSCKQVYSCLQPPANYLDVLAALAPGAPSLTAGER